MISSDDFRKITTLIFDVDGILTDGRVAWLDSGEAVKFFHYQDMHWLKMAIRAGLRVGLLSAASDSANLRIKDKLGLSFAVTGMKNKLEGFEKILQEYHLTPEECLFAGDDVVDMPVLRRAGISVTAADGVPELDEVVRWRTRLPGGRGAAREIVVRVLKEKNLYEKIMERYRR